MNSPSGLDEIAIPTGLIVGVQLRIHMDYDERPLMYLQGLVEGVLFERSGSNDVITATFSFSKAWKNSNDSKGWVPYDKTTFSARFKGHSKLKHVFEHGGTCDFMGPRSGWVMPVMKSNTMMWQE